MRGNLPLAPRRFPPPPLMGRKSAHEPLRVVSRSRERDRRVRAADDRGRGRADALRAREAALTGTFVSLHVLTLFVDSYLPFSLTQLVVPGASTYRPLSTALGVVAAELLLALRSRIGIGN